MTYFTDISVNDLCVFANRETLVEFFGCKFVVEPKALIAINLQLSTTLPGSKYFKSRQTN